MIHKMCVKSLIKQWSDSYTKKGDPDGYYFNSVYPNFSILYPEFSCGRYFTLIQSTISSKLAWTIIYIILSIVLYCFKLPIVIRFIPFFLQVLNLLAEYKLQSKRKTMFYSMLYPTQKFASPILNAYRTVVYYQLYVTILTLIVPPVILILYHTIFN